MALTRSDSGITRMPSPPLMLMFAIRINHAIPFRIFNGILRCQIAIPRFILPEG